MAWDRGTARHGNCDRTPRRSVHGLAAAESAGIEFRAGARRDDRDQVGMTRGKEEIEDPMRAITCMHMIDASCMHARWIGG